MTTSGKALAAHRRCNMEGAGGHLELLLFPRDAVISRQPAQALGTAPQIQNTTTFVHAFCCFLRSSCFNHHHQLHLFSRLLPAPEAMT